MQHPDPMFFNLQRLSSDFAKINRRHYRLGSNQRENDIEHSYTVALLCWYIITKHRISLDLSKVLGYALAHDLVEVYAGDVSQFASPDKRKQKEINEKQALAKLENELSGFKALCAAMSGYETKNDEESLFVWTVDKMQALILGDLDSWRPYRESEDNITYEFFVQKYSQLLKQASPYAQEIFKELIEYCKTTYYDQPEDAVAQ